MTVDLSTRTTPSWYDEAKLGVFVHWNPAAIPAFAPKVRDIRAMPDDEDGSKMFRMLPYAEMYLNALNIPESATARYHAVHYSDQSYDSFVEHFRDDLIEKWNPEPLADLCSRAGARYVVMYTKMEDGFVPWPSALPHPTKDRWCSKRDAVGDLADAVRARGMKYGVGYSGAMDWSFHGLPLTDFESVSRVMAELDSDYLEYAVGHLDELIERYKPEVLWNDWGMPNGVDLASLFKRYFERVPEGVVNNRFDPPPFRDLTVQPSDVYSDFLTPEYEIKGTPELKWEACRGVGKSFGYNRQEADAEHMSSTELIHLFVDIVSRGGNLLLNLGLTATGDPAWPQAKRLLELGWWLSVNGGAIYGTRPWERSSGITEEGIEIRYTRSDDAVHAIVLGTPVNPDLRSPSVELDVRLDDNAEVFIEGTTDPLPWGRTPAGVRVQLPEPPADQPTLVFRLTPAAAVGS